VRQLNGSSNLFGSSRLSYDAVSTNINENLRDINVGSRYALVSLVLQLYRSRDLMQNSVHMDHPLWPEGEKID
jgi:hypothetical protein